MQAKRTGGRHRDSMVFGHVRRVLRRIRAERGGAQAPILIQRQVTSPEVMLGFRAALVLVVCQ